MARPVRKSSGLHAKADAVRERRRAGHWCAFCHQPVGQVIGEQMVMIVHDHTVSWLHDVCVLELESRIERRKRDRGTN
jgi:hypothetical protein